MRQARLDQTDRRIRRELQADGRITNVELARKVGISAPPCLRRVRALEEAGFIRGYAALLDDRALGFDVTAFAMVGLHSQAEVDLVAFEQRVRGSAIVRDCYMLSGEIDFMLKCGAGPYCIPGFHHSRAHRRAECRQRQDLSRHPRLEARSWRADRGHAGKRQDGACRRTRTNLTFHILSAISKSEAVQDNPILVE